MPKICQHRNTYNTVRKLFIFKFKIKNSRPLWWEVESTEAFLCDDEFFVGDRLLVAPVVKERTYSRTVILPEGTWEDERGEKFTGPSKIEIAVPIERIPFFWKKVEGTSCSVL